MHSFFNNLSFLLLCLGNFKEEHSDNAEVFNHFVEGLSFLCFVFHWENLFVPAILKDLSALSDLIDILPEKEVACLVFEENLQILVAKPVLDLLVDRGVFLCQLFFGPSSLWIEDGFDCSVERMWELKLVIFSSQFLDVVSFDELLQIAEDLLGDGFEAYQDVSCVARLFRLLASSSKHPSSFKGLSHFNNEWVEYSLCLWREMHS